MTKWRPSSSAKFLQLARSSAAAGLGKQTRQFVRTTLYTTELFVL